MIKASAWYVYQYDTAQERAAIFATLPPGVEVLDNPALKQVSYAIDQHEVTLAQLGITDEVIG